MEGSVSTMDAAIWNGLVDGGVSSKAGVGRVEKEELGG